MAAVNDSKGVGVATSSNGNYGTKSGASPGTVSGGTGHSSGGGGMVQNTNLGAEELAAKAAVGNGGQHRLKLLTLAAATL